MQKPWFGHGRGDDYLIHDNVGSLVSVPDGMWIIAFGTGGIAGLIALFAAMILPTVLIARRFPPHTWNHPTIAGAAALAVFMLTYAIDCLMNAMVNPVYLVALGGLAAVAVAKDPTVSRRRPPLSVSSGSRS